MYDVSLMQMNACMYDINQWCGTFRWRTDSWANEPTNDSMILMHAYIYDAANLDSRQTDEQTDGQGDSRSRVYDAWMYMYISMILMHACIYDAANFVPDRRTNKRTDKAILWVGYDYTSANLPFNNKHF